MTRFVSTKNWTRETIPPIAAYVALDIALTLMFVALSPKSVEIGTLRRQVAIPPKIGELLIVGVALGLVSSLSFFRKLDLSLVTLFTAFVVLLDVDHLPAALGYQEPIRPAHTFAFLLILLGVLSFTIKKQPEVELVAISAFLGHIASDTGEFALFAPFSFAYSGIDAYRIPIAIVAVAFAVGAGYLKYRRYRGQGIKISSMEGMVMEK